jgi:serine/threonine-protein kinase
MIGEVFGRYRVVRKIGEGGMGAVYVAEHTLIGRHAALKVLLDEMSHRKELVTRFFNEARAASAVKHPGIVEIYDFGYHTSGSAYIVMEYLDGESLAARLRREGTLSEARAAALCRQICGALAAAHAKGIVHRDLKPDNVFIVRDADTADGERTKLIDFGIAKLAATDASPGAKTGTGILMGTPAYMSPEQSKGAGQIDSRTDIYALGCMLFEMLCGQPPFVAEGAGELMAKHIMASPPPPSSLAAVTPQMERVILRALAKSPDQRFQTADELIAALDVAVPSGARPRARRFTPAARTQPELAISPKPTTLSEATGSAPIGAAPIPRAESRALWLVLGVAIVVILGGGAFVFLKANRGAAPLAAQAPEPTPPPDPAPAPAPLPDPAPAPAPPPDPAPAPAPAPSPNPAAPATITIKLDSTPHGADVYRLPQGVRIGTTPVTYAMDSLDGRVVMLVKKPGYGDKEITLPANQDSVQTVKLARATASHSHASTPRRQQDSAAQAASSTLDPFDKVIRKEQP